jgi:hypothetical protein
LRSDLGSVSSYVNWRHRGQNLGPANGYYQVPRMRSRREHDGRQMSRVRRTDYSTANISARYLLAKYPNSLPGAFGHGSDCRPALGGLGRQNSRTNNTASQNVTSNATSQTAAGEVPSLSLPRDQQMFVRAVFDARGRYEAGTTELQKGSARPWRAQAICNAFRSPTVWYARNGAEYLDFEGWVGKLTELSTNSDGDGVLSIEIAPKVWLKTWNNSLSDIGDHTLIKPDTHLYRDLMAFTKGKYVSFSGSFIKSGTDCVRERSMTIEGSMTEPEFIVRFTTVDAMNPASNSAKQGGARSTFAPQAQQPAPTAAPSKCYGHAANGALTVYAPINGRCP